jgi:1-aminocyclopropane-1-carboxylate deaminase/D-cysteine desulfhydrase-like pyridoxal-dependent ACC family enzyme
MKMDDWTGFALGGNKVRKLEFYLGGDGARADTLITCGGPQSNHCRVTAATAAQLGMRCILVVNGTPPDPPTGNALLMEIFGAEVRPVADREARAPGMEATAEEVRQGGGNPLVIPLGASTPLGALGYVRAAVELDRQMEEAGGWPQGRTWIFISSSSCGTLAGLALGFTLLGRENVRLVGVSPDVTEEEITNVTRSIAMGAGKLLEWEGDLLPDLITPEARFVGEGYGIPSPASNEAARVFGASAGVVLDPVYTAKAGAGFLDWVRNGRIPPGDTALFWHTGGAPALFT